MLKKMKAIPVVAAMLATCLVAAAAYALPSALSQSALETQAYSTQLKRHALPVSEPSLETDFNYIVGTNWMSGISGELFLHEINIPGTHDACVWDPYTAFAIAKTQYSYAKTQNLNIE